MRGIKLFLFFVFFLFFFSVPTCFLCSFRILLSLSLSSIFLISFFFFCSLISSLFFCKSRLLPKTGVFFFYALLVCLIFFLLFFCGNFFIMSTSFPCKNGIVSSIFICPVQNTNPYAKHRNGMPIPRRCKMKHWSSFKLNITHLIVIRHKPKTNRGCKDRKNLTVTNIVPFNAIRQNTHGNFRLNGKFIHLYTEPCTKQKWTYIKRTNIAAVLRQRMLIFKPSAQSPVNGIRHPYKFRKKKFGHHACTKIH